MEEENLGVALVKILALLFFVCAVWVWLFQPEKRIEERVSAHVYAIGMCMADLLTEGEDDVHKAEAICRARQDRQH